MVAWSLSVALTGNADGLVRSLRQSTREARDLKTELAAVRREVGRLNSAGQPLRQLATGLRANGAPLRGLRQDATAAGRGLRTLGRDADAAARAQRAGSRAARTATGDLRTMARQVRTTTRDLTTLARTARTTDGRLATVGARGARSLREGESAARRMRSELVGLTALLAGGGLVLGLHDLVENGNEYQAGMATFRAVTGATASQMQRASATAKALGADLELPTATAGGAAESMVELAKAGFRTDQAISATRASLVLSAAANVNAADSARYLGDMMDQFAMGADQAGRAADILAATANNASGDVVDIYYAMKYAGPVAHGLGVSMEEAAAGVGMLGKAGILGQTAGTTLRGIFTNLAKPTKQMQDGLHDLGIEAWDTQGRFKGLRYVIEQLSHAQHTMSPKDFTAAAAKAFGKPALAGAVALAHQGVASFDALNQAVNQNGAAAQIASARNQGLAGAMVLLKKQTRQTGLEIYQGLAPGLEWLTRGLTSGMAKATPYITSSLAYARDLAHLFGPDLAAQARAGLGGLVDEAKALLGPLRALGEHALADGLHLLISTGEALMTVLQNIEQGLTPVGDALADVSQQGDGAANALDIVVLAVDAAVSTVQALSSVLIPIGHLVALLVSGFGALPAPVQSAVFAMLLARRVLPVFSSLATTVRGRVTSAFTGLNGQMAVQRSLAAASGQTLSRYGATMAVLQTRIPVIGRMGDAFRTATREGTGFAGTLRGVTAAAGTGLRGAMGGLMGAMGGPWGVALAGLTVGLGLLADSEQKASARAAEHKANIDGLSSALRESNGLIDENVRQQAAQTLQNTKLAGSNKSLADFMGQMGYSLSDLTDSYLGQGQSVDQLADKLQALSKAKFEEANEEGHGFGILDRRSKETKAVEAQSRTYAAAASALRGMSGDAKTAAKNAKDLDAATKGDGDGVSAYGRLKDAVSALADRTADADQRTRALRDALDLLSGGSVSMQAAEARLNEAVLNANDAVDDQIKKSGDYGKSLVGLNGTLNTTTRNGQQLYSSLNSISDAAASSSIAAFDFAQKQGKDLPTSLKAARSEMDKARKAALDLLTQYGITGKQAQQVADAVGLIPGQVSILLQTKGVDQTLAELLAVQAEYSQFPTKRTITVEALGEQAQKELKKLGYAIELIPGTREYKITAPTLGARRELDAFIATLAATPDHKNVTVSAATRATVKDLQAVQSLIRGTKGTTVTMRAPTTAARAELEKLGFKIKNTKGKKVTITVPTGGPTDAVSAIQRAINGMQGKTVTVRINGVATGVDPSKYYSQGPHMGKASGGIVDYYASGGIRTAGGADPGDRRDQHLAQIAPSGTYRVWAERETEGEGYVPFRRSARPRSRAITEEIVRRLGGDPSGISWNAAGSVTDWRYDPQSGSLYSASDAGQAGHKTKKVKIKGKVQEVEYFDVGAVEKKLLSAAKATRAWNADLEKVAARAGGDVADALAGMGEDGMRIAHKMATGSTAYINKMSKALRDLQATAKATLSDYTRQLTKANQLDATFSKNLAALASQGYGDLAQQLAAQNDEAAQQLAAEAVKDKKKAASANKAAKTANAALSSDQVDELVQIIAAITTGTTGIHQVAATTGLDEDEIIDVATKAKTQIKTSLGARAERFLSDLTKAGKGLAYADGGIREGIYSTSAGLVRFAEPSTNGEAYVPFALSKRRRATAVLSDVAGQFGYALTGQQDAAAGRVQVLVIQQPAPLIGTQTIQIDRPGATEQQIASAVGYQLRRAQRGGVANR